MDCFLIRHCIWNKKEQIEATYVFVRSPIEKQWDQRIDNFFSIIGGMKETIEKYRAKDLDHFCKIYSWSQY